MNPLHKKHYISFNESAFSAVVRGDWSKECEYGRHHKKMKVMTWNLDWASPRSKRGGIIRELIQEIDADLDVLSAEIMEMLREVHS